MVQTFDSPSLSKIKLPFQKSIFTRHIIKVSEENKSIICCSCLSKMSLCNISFDLWMFKGACDAFALVINFLSSDW